MKAEHRKELETNVLADRVGKLVQGMKTAPQKKFLLWVILAVAIGVVGLFAWRRVTIRGEESSQMWTYLENGSLPHLQLVHGQPDTTQAKIAKLEQAWIFLWENGIKLLGHQPKQALNYMEDAEQTYQLLEKDTKSEPALHAETLYCLALIEETRLAVNPKDQKEWAAGLERVKDKYQIVVKDYKDSAYGKMAAKRIAVLDDNDKRRDLQGIYDYMQQQLNIREDRLFDLKGPDFNLPKLP